MIPRAEQEAMTEDPDEYLIEQEIARKDPMRVPDSLESIDWRLQYGIPELKLIGWDYRRIARTDPLALLVAQNETLLQKIIVVRRPVQGFPSAIYDRPE